MSCVSLVCTVHEEMGLANASELRAILEHIRPEVIFLEVPPAAFDNYYENCSQANLESSAVRQYRKGHAAKLVPVDLPTPGEDFFADIEYLRRRIRKESPEYHRLVSWDSDYIRRYGFAYLNSEHCCKLWAEIYQEILSTIRRIDDARLVELYGLWNKTIDLRENEMMKNIRKYCRENTSESGVFLVGAAHRQSIIDKSAEQSAVDSTSLQWDFAGWVSEMIQQSGA